MAPHSSTLACKIPWTEEPGRLLSLFISMHWESEVAQSRPTLCDPMGCSRPGSSVHEIFQARVLKWVAISFCRGSSHPRDRSRVSRTAGRCFTVWATREAKGNGSPLQCSCLENPRDGGAWWAAVYGVTQSWTWLKRLSSSSRPRMNLQSSYNLDTRYGAIGTACHLRKNVLL